MKNLAFTLLAGLFLFSHYSAAQTIDPSMLEALKNRAGTSVGSSTVVSPLDQGRQKEFQGRQERLLQQRKAKLSRKSRLEEDYQNRLGSNITQYGYSIFRNLPSMDGVMTGTVSDSYKLGIGDELVVTFQGSKSQTYTVRVDLEGRVIIPELKPITVSGMSYGNFKSILRKQVEESIIGTEVYVSLASVRMITVFVVGEVNTPGVVRTSSLATPLEILMNAGGVKKTGSLRNITIYRGGKKSVYDIYALLNGHNTDFEGLNEGDRIVIPTIGATIAMDGEVVRPGIYELPANQSSISYQEAMNLAGGTLRPAGYAMSQISIDAEGRQSFHEIDSAEKIHTGEAIIARLVENSQTGKVGLVGHVRTPGYRSLSSAKNIRGLLGDVLNLKDDPYLIFGLIERVDNRTQTRLLLPFSPEKILNEGQDIALQDRDRVIFLGRDDISFLFSDAVRQVIFSGAYGKQTCKPLRNLARIINDTQSDRFAAATRAVFVRKGVTVEKEKKTGEAEKENLQLRNFSNKESAQLVQTENIQRLKKEKSDRSCPTIYQQVNNLLPFILEYIVSVDGAVRMPGVYPVIHDTPIASLLAVSGGTSNDANLTNVEVSSYETKVDSSFRYMKWNYIDATQTDLKTVTINPGGGVRVGSKVSNFESGAVLLSGEFMQPGVYTIRKGEKLSELILRAGGVSDQAYTYGAIFTRKRVKDIQRAELQQTAKHLQSAMISASVKKNIESDSLMAAQQLTNQLVNAEIIGRVVIEADPLKLSLEPALDTVLEAGDSLYMPKRPNFVIAMGDVLNPGALQFIPGKGIADYIEEVGSYTASADEGRIYIVYPNGVAKPISLSSWAGDRDLSIPPGTAIVVPTDLSPYDSLALVREIGDIFRNLAVSAASIAILIR